jgi:hypothetical protein
MTETPSSTPTPECLHTGDVDNSSIVTVGDAQLTFAIALSFIQPDYFQSCASNCNGDGFITVGDAQLIFLTALAAGTCMDQP